MIVLLSIILQKKVLKSSFIIIDSVSQLTQLQQKIESMGNFACLATCSSIEDGVNKTLEHRPDLVFLYTSGISQPFAFMSEIAEYLEVVPSVIIISDGPDLAYESYRRGISGYLLNPINTDELRRCLFRFQKNRPIASTPKRISIKSQSDYHFLKAEDILYLKADNNTTDFFLTGGKMVTAYKTLKHFENLLPSNFYRIHHSYVINSDFVSRINLTKGNCFLDNSIILPFSRTYKLNVDAIIKNIAL